jgi:hypothetical protein
MPEVVNKVKAKRIKTKPVDRLAEEISSFIADLSSKGVV